MLTGFAAEEKLVPVIKAGAVGYLLKDAAPQDLLQAIRDVAQGVCSLHPQLAHTLLCALRRPAVRPAAESLTGREREVACLLALGRSNKEIARALLLSEPTVRTHVSHILGKLNLSNRTEVVRYALCEGLAPACDCGRMPNHGHCGASAADILGQDISANAYSSGAFSTAKATTR